MKINAVPIQSFPEYPSSFNYRMSMDTKCQVNSISQNNFYTHVIVDAFSPFVFTVPIKSNKTKAALKTFLYHWIVKIDPPIYLVTDRVSIYEC